MLRRLAILGMKALCNQLANLLKRTVKTVCADTRLLPAFTLPIAPTHSPPTSGLSRRSHQS
jgi:hypothetical protein